MKLNWGTGIAAVLIAFVGMMAWFAVRAMNNPSPLVAEDYYKQELVYQGEIDKLGRSIVPGNDVVVEQKAGLLVFRFPHVKNGSRITGDLQLMRPSDELGDHAMPVSVDTNGVFILPTQDLIKGMYRMRLDWSLDGEERLSEQAIVVR